MSLPAVSISLQNKIRDAAASSLFKLGASEALLRREAARPIVLLYHNPNPAIFQQHLAFLAEHYAFVPAPGLEGASVRGPSVAFTFDDGYRGVHVDILPLLRQAKAPATMFVPTGFLGRRFGYEALKLALQKSPRRSVTFQGRTLPLGSVAQRKDAWHALVAELKLLPAAMRDERMSAIIDDLAVAAAEIAGAEIVTESELALMAEQLEIGSHTVTHPNLARLGPDETRRELLDSKSQLEAITGKPCRLFAYPIGRSEDYTQATVSALQHTGYAKAFTAVPTTSAESDFEYPRVGVGDQDSVETLCLKLSRVWPVLHRLLIS